MRDLNKTLLKSRSISLDNLIKFGFKKSKDNYRFEKEIKDGDFSIIIEVGKNDIISEVIDNFDNSEYALSEE